MNRRGSRLSKQCLLAVLFTAGLLLAGEDPAFAVFSGEMSPRPPSGDKEYAAGIDAFERQDWPAVVFHMARVVGNRPHHDNAWARLGYAHRKLGHYRAALFAYGRALELDPHHRGAMEYLGEAYIELGRYVDAVAMLDRLAGECKRVALTFSDGAFGNGCSEYKTLKTLIDLVGGDTSAVEAKWD